MAHVLHGFAEKYGDYIAKYSEDQWVGMLTPHVDEFKQVLAMFREFDPEKKPTTEKKKIGKRGRKPRMSEDERRKRKNAAVQKHRDGIKNTINSCEAEIKDLHKQRNSLDKSLELHLESLNILRQMQQDVIGRMEKENFRVTKEVFPVSAPSTRKSVFG